MMVANSGKDDMRFELGALHSILQKQKSTEFFDVTDISNPLKIKKFSCQ